MSTLRRINPNQQGHLLTWGNDLFQRCSNVVEMPQPPQVEALPVPDVVESSWPEWDEAVLHQDRRDAWSQFPVLVDVVTTAQASKIGSKR